MDPNFDKLVQRLEHDRVITKKHILYAQRPDVDHRQLIKNSNRIVLTANEDQKLNWILNHLEEVENDIVIIYGCNIATKAIFENAKDHIILVPESVKFVVLLKSIFDFLKLKQNFSTKICLINAGKDADVQEDDSELCNIHQFINNDVYHNKDVYRNQQPNFDPLNQLLSIRWFSYVCMVKTLKNLNDMNRGAWDQLIMFSQTAAELEHKTVSKYFTIYQRIKYTIHNCKDPLEAAIINLPVNQNLVIDKYYYLDILSKKNITLVTNESDSSIGIQKPEEQKQCDESTCPTLILASPFSVSLDDAIQDWIQSLNGIQSKTSTFRFDRNVKLNYCLAPVVLNGSNFYHGVLTMVDQRSEKIITIVKIGDDSNHVKSSMMLEVLRCLLDFK